MMHTRLRFGALTLLAAVFASAVVLACGDGETVPDATATPSPTATPTATAATTPTPEPSPSPTPTPTPAPAPTPTPTPTPAPAAQPAPTPASPAEAPAPPPPPPPPAPPTYGIQRIAPAADFGRMIEMVMYPGSSDEALIANQSGLVWRVSVSQNQRELIGDLRSKVGAGGFEEGLLSITFSPNFAQDRLVYAYYTRGSPGASVLSSFRIPGNHIDPTTETVILEVPQPFSNHNGGRVLFGPDGHLYLSLGDGGSGGDPQGHGQNSGTLLGSIIRISVSGGSGYTVPGDNPFVGQAARDEIWAYGLRNPWRFSFDRATGALWLGDVGQGRWEEVNRIQRGGNYGWNVMEGYECYSPPSGCNQAGLQLPRTVYPIAGRPECAITGGYVYRGSALPELAGWYIYGDYCSGKIWALNTADVSEPVLLLDTGLSITSFAELPGGEIAVITSNNAIYRLTR